MKRPEQTLQIQVAKYLAVALKPPVWWSAIGHGGGGASRGAFLKAMGMKAGVPDIILLWPNNKAGIELKAPKGKLSPAQKQIIKDWSAAGAYVGVCKSLEEVAALLTKLGVPLHASVS